MTTTTLSSHVVTIRKPAQCWGCLRQFPIGSQLLSEAIVEGDIRRVYTCEQCHSEIYGMDGWDLESTGWGEVGYWKDDAYHPMNN